MQRASWLDKEQIVGQQRKFSKVKLAKSGRINTFIGSFDYELAECGRGPGDGVASESPGHTT